MTSICKGCGSADQRVAVGVAVAVGVFVAVAVGVCVIVGVGVAGSGVAVLVGNTASVTALVAWVVGTAWETAVSSSASDAQATSPKSSAKIIKLK